MDMRVLSVALNMNKNIYSTSYICTNFVNCSILLQTHNVSLNDKYKLVNWSKFS